MTASPAQIANDLEAQARFFAKRDDYVARACQDAARMIRQNLAGQPVDGRTWGGLHQRLLTLTTRRGLYPGTQIERSLDRGLQCLMAFRCGKPAVWERAGSDVE